MLDIIDHPEFGSALIVCSVGTDHHRFDRLVSWVDEWAEENPLVEVIIQHGTADKPRIAVGEELIPHDLLRQLFARASLVISHAGPSTVMDARMAGKLPVVVPRDPSQGEHIDDHQLSFGEHVARHGLGTTVVTKEGLFANMNLAVTEPERFRIDIEPETSAPGVAAFGRHLDGLLGVTTALADPVAAASDAAA